MDPDDGFYFDIHHAAVTSVQRTKTLLAEHPPSELLALRDAQGNNALHLALRENRVDVAEALLDAEEAEMMGNSGRIAGGSAGGRGGDDEEEDDGEDEDEDGGNADDMMDDVPNEQNQFSENVHRDAFDYNSENENEEDSYDDDEEESNLLVSRDGQGLPPLLVALSAGSKDCAVMLLERGANPNAYAPLSGETALHLAAVHGFADLVSDLVHRYGASAHQLDFEEENALHYALRSGDKATVEACVDLRMDCHQRNADGESPVDLASLFDMPVGRLGRIPC